MSPSQRLLVVGTALTLVLATILFGTYAALWRRPSLDFIPIVGDVDRHFHFILPATAATIDLCRLMFSGLVNGYPEPVLLGWDGHGLYNGAESHLFKVSEALAYLTRLPKSADDDLVLLLDAYDIFFQLRPDVLIARYFDVIERENKRLKDQGIYGINQGGAKIRQSILFGADKVCWPDELQRAACWAVPKSSLEDDALGPATDADTTPGRTLDRPRWLNSGTIIGPVKDMREMFNATMYQIKRYYDEEYYFRRSDQYYFQEVWAEQEVRRTILRDGNIKAPVLGHDQNGEDVRGHVPNLAHRRRTEFHIAMDYETRLFQISTGTTEFITWMSFNHTTPSHPKHQSKKRIDQTPLPADIARSPPPFTIAQHGEDEYSDLLSWENLMLGINGITRTIFPLFHVTGDKSFRQRWWPRMWYYKDGRRMLTVAKETQFTRTSDLVAIVDGVKWKAYPYPDLFAGEESTTSTAERALSMGGAWSDQGQHLSWDDLCAMHEEELFA